MRTLHTVATRRGSITIIHDAVPADVAACTLNPDGWTIIRNPQVLRTFLDRSAADPQARLTLAVADGVIVGRAVVAASFGRWQKLPRVREFAIEAVREWRRTGVASRLMQAALADPAVEDEIILAFTLPSAWDLDYARLSLSNYGRLLAVNASRYGFRRVGTDEPEVMFQLGAALLVRIGARVPSEAVAAFEEARYERRPVGVSPAQAHPSVGEATDPTDRPAPLPLRVARRVLSLLSVAGRAA